MAKWSDRAIEADSNARDGHVHELIVMGSVVLLERSHQLVENILWYFASSPLQVGEAGETEVCIEIVSSRIELSAHQIASHFEFHSE